MELEQGLVTVDCSRSSRLFPTIGPNPGRQLLISQANPARHSGGALLFTGVQFTNWRSKHGAHAKGTIAFNFGRT